MQPPDDTRRGLNHEAFRAALRAVVARSGRSLRSLSLAMGRDPGYLAALLDPSRPSRARPNPDDLVALSDSTGIPLIELLEALWDIPITRFEQELEQHGVGDGQRVDVAALASADQRMVAEFAAFLAESRRKAATRITRRRGPSP